MDMLAGLAGFCALAANENFGDLAASFFTVGHANSSDKIPYIGPARVKGLEAVAAWGDGEPAKIGQLFTMGLRMLNQEVNKLESLQDQQGPVVNAKQGQGQQPVNAHEMQQKEVSM